jgi:predicted ArsR family transcriptional regulator
MSIAKTRSMESYMNDTAGLPETIARSIDLLLDSLGGLEALIALYREADRSWTPDEMASHLRITHRAARQELDRLSSRGVAHASGADGERAYRYRPRDPTHAEHVARIADAYATRRIETINYVASSSLRRIRPGSV